MASEAAALLDELMGSQRNALPGEKVRETRWSDPEVCRNFLCGFCPSELFTNTKSDIGPCDKLHDERLKRLYQESDRFGKLGYEDEFLHYLEKIVRDLDRRIERGRERLQKSVSAKQKVLQGESGINSDKLKALNDEINLRVAELDHLGTQGQVEEAQQLMKRVEELEKEREKERMHLVNMTHKRVGGFDLDAHDFHEKMELCDVCGSFLVIGDVQLRVDAHLLGKQHLGFARIRSTIADLKKSKEDKIKKRHGESEDGDRRSSGHDEKDGERSKNDEKEKHVKGKTWRVSRDSRSRSRERDHGKQLPRSREQRPRSQERENKGIGRSRSKEREAESKGIGRSRSKEREVTKRRSRSRSRGKEQPGKRHRRSMSREKEKRDERHRSRSKSRDRKEEDRPRERLKDREGKERSREEKSRDDRPREEKSRDDRPREEKSRDDGPREEKSREEKSRDDRPREDRHEGRDRGREDRRDRDRDRNGRPKEREDRDKPKDSSVKDREGSR